MGHYYALNNTRPQHSPARVMQFANCHILLVLYVPYACACVGASGALHERVVGRRSVRVGTSCHPVNTRTQTVLASGCAVCAWRSSWLAVQVQAVHVSP